MPNQNEGSNPPGDSPPNPRPSNRETPTVLITPKQPIPGDYQTADTRDNFTASETKRELHWLEKLNFAGQLSLVVVGVVAASIYGCQLKTMNGQLKEMQGSGEQTKQLLCLYQRQLAQLTKQATDTHDLAVAAGNQADQALIQANGTHSLAQTSKDALVSVQRAFIFATGFDAIRIGDPNDPNKVDSVEVSITWENNGTTPTRNMSTHYSYLPSPSPQPDSLFFTDLGNTIPAPIALGPKAVGHTAPISIPAGTVTEIMNHKTVFYIWGWARYNDIFAKSKRHITRFCTAITGFQGNPLNGSPSAISRPVLANCASNCYDDECKVQ
jgi:hypothetical protein